MMRLWLVLETVLACLFGALWLAAMPLSLMGFGAPGTRVDARAWAFALTLWSYPFWTFGPIIIAWALYARGRHRAAGRLSLTPPLIGLFAAIIFWH
jgi:hypothetical protein